LDCAIGRYPFIKKGERGDMSVMGRIADARIDECIAGDKVSDGFRDFVGKCLTKEPKNRPSAEELLKHSFIEKHKDMKDKAIQWLKNVKDM